VDFGTFSDELELLEDDAPTEPLGVAADEVALDEDAGPAVPSVATSEPQASPPSVASGAISAVAVVDEGSVRVELARPARLVRAGWIAAGVVRIGNHAGCDVVIPEIRIAPTQAFVPNDHLTLRVRGTTAEVVSVGVDARMGDGPASPGPWPRDAVLGVVRRDETGAEDLVVGLSLVADPALPDPRARLLALDLGDPQVVSLGVVGLPVGVGRSVALEGFRGSAEVMADGHLVLSGYLDAYRDPTSPGGFRPWFVSDGDRFTTLPEDGRAILLRPGERLVIGTAVWMYQRR
jgi:hypothetical protein